MDFIINRLKGIVLLIFLLSQTFSLSQSTLTVKYFGLTIHPFGDKTASIQPYKLDEKARFVANFGCFVGYEKYVYKNYFSVKLIEAIFTDCSSGWAMFHHLGARFLLLERGKSYLYFGIGPTYLIRNSWTRFGEKYNSSGYFNVRESKLLGTVQSKLIPYGLEFEYDYKFSTENRLSISFTPGVPLACIFSIGWKYTFNPKEFSSYKFYQP